MGTDFVLQVKGTKFWLNRGLRVYLDLYVSDFQKVPLSTFYILIVFSPKHPILEVFFVKTHPNHVKPSLAQKIQNLVKSTFKI